MAASGGNVVSIVVEATDDTAEGFDASKAAADSAADSMHTYTNAVNEAADAQARFDAAQEEQRAAAEELATLQQDDAASADELAAATDKLTGASLAAADARKALAAAEEDVAAQTKIASDEQVTAGLKSDEAAEESGGAMAAAGSKAKLALLGVAVGAGVAVKAAMDYQEQSTQLVTGAGELSKNLKMVEQGMLDLSVSTDTSTSQLESGMYMIESAGYHGAQGLAVLKAAAEGAKVGNADLGDTANALTSILNAYHLKASDATAVTDQLVATVASGKMHMQDLASSISAVLPVAASAGISFSQVGGALATMTAQGVSAHRAAQNLATTIRSLLSPNATAADEMRDLGLSANDVSTHLGQRGLTGTISLLTEAILKNSKGGSVLASTYNAMSPAAQGIAREIAAGTISTNDLSTAMKALSPEQAALITQFQTSATSATGLKQTFDAAMQKMVGGAQGLNTVLELGGKNASVFSGNVSTVADAAKRAGGDVNGFAETQKDLSFQMGKAENAIKAAGISLGMALLPAVTAIVKPLASLLQLIAGNHAAAIAFAVVVGGVLAGALGGKLAGAFKDLKSGISDMGDGLQWLLGKLGLTTAATEAQTAATEAGAEAQTEADAAMDANPIGLIVIALVALVAAIVEVVKHWHAIADAAKEAFRALKEAVMDVVGFVKTHWELLLAILLGPIALAALFIKDHWDQIRHDTAAFAGDVVKTVTKLAGDVENTVTRLAADVVNFFKQGFDRVTGDVRNWETDIGREFEHLFDMLVQRVTGGLGNIVHWFEGLPGRIVSALAGLGKALFDAGVHAIEGLIDGVTSMIGKVGHIAGDVGHAVESGFKSVLGIFSPSSVMMQHGQDVVAGLVQGITASVPQAVKAMNMLAAALAAAGRAAVTGLVDGMRSMTAELTAVVAQLGALADQAMKDKLEISSPSRVFERHGQMIAAGLIQGMDSSLGMVGAATRRLAAAAALGTAASPALAGVAGIGPGSVAYAGAGAAGAGTLHLVWDLQGADEDLLKLFRNRIRVQGGNVQQVLGH